MAIKLFIFDLDGTLFSTVEANIRAYTKAFAECGIKLPGDVYRSKFGLRADDLLKTLAPGMTDDDKAGLRHKKAEHYRDSVALVKPNLPLIEFLKDMSRTHKTAVVTTASRVNALFILDHFGLTEFLDYMIFGEDVTKGKPDPECYLKCLSESGFTAADAVVFEDSEVGEEAAREAGISVVRVKINEE